MREWPRAASIAYSSSAHASVKYVIYRRERINQSIVLGSATLRRSIAAQCKTMSYRNVILRRAAKTAYHRTSGMPLELALKCASPVACLNGHQAQIIARATERRVISAINKNHQSPMSSASGRRHHRRPPSSIAQYLIIGHLHQYDVPWRAKRSILSSPMFRRRKLRENQLRLRA